MSRSSARLLPGAALALGIALLALPETQAAPPTPEVLAARKALVDLADRLAGGQVIAPAEVAAFRKQHDELNDVMTVFTHRKIGGLGVGTVKHGDGIEYKPIQLTRKALTPAQMQVEQAELARMGHVIRAVAKVLPAYGPTKLPAGEKAWRDHVALFDRKAEALSRAIAGGSPTAVRRSAARANDACNDCHSAARRGVFNR